MTGSDVVAVSDPPAITTQPASQTVCPNRNTVFSVTATGTSLSYQWQLSIDQGTSFSNIIDGDAYSGAITSSLNITNPSAFNGYQYRVIVNGPSGCQPAISNIANLTTTGNIWRGITSVDWNTLSNWACNIPIETDDVFVPDTAKHMPRLNDNTTVHSLTLESPEPVLI
jgi:hypothetical protein